ncbi:MAG: hypothetical protein V3U54_04610 [Thermodesulfobacteriota bacterium]
MTDKIEIPEEVREHVLYCVNNNVTHNRTIQWIYDLIQKQDNEIGVGDWYYKPTDDGGIWFAKCKSREEADKANAWAKYKKAPKELIAGLEKLRNG